MSTESEKDRELAKSKRNIARYFTENRHVAWVLLVATCLWGIYGYNRMPKAKDPTIPIRQAVATCAWPGATAEKVEQLITRKLEAKVAENPRVEKIESISRSGAAVVYFSLKEDVVDRGKEFDDVKLKLDAIRDLPEGAGPIVFIKDFGETSALMLTVASPKVNDIELTLRARAITSAIANVRHGATGHATVLVSFPAGINLSTLRRDADSVSHFLIESGRGTEPKLVEGAGFLGVDIKTDEDGTTLGKDVLAFARDELHLAELHPDVWWPIVVTDPSQTESKLIATAGDRYSYRQLDEYTDTLARHLQSLPLVAKVTRSGVVPEQITLDYSQERLAEYGIDLTRLKEVLQSRNITLPGGMLEVGGKNVSIDPSGEIKSDAELGDILVSTSTTGAPVYLRDLVEIGRGYQSPARNLNFISVRRADGTFERVRAITLAVQMRPGMQIADFGDAIDKKIAEVRQLFPEDLIFRRTSDQPLQVRENVDLFMNSLNEAIVLVVIVALIGFWEWRSALLMALSIPITLAMTFGFMYSLGIDLQQISIASLILALGLLVDDPVVAGDAIKRALGQGWRPLVAAWLGPTKLATAILFATVTNIAAYLPMLAMAGDTGKFIYSLPIVITCALVASRIVSMSFIPLLGYYILRPPAEREPTRQERREHGFEKKYAEIVAWAIDHRRQVALGALAFLCVGGLTATRLKSAFFPKDLSYLSYVDLWLPEDAPLSATQLKAREADLIIREVVEKYAQDHHRKDPVLESVTSFIGSGAPRFWYSVAPELSQLNYAQLIIQVADKHDTEALVAPLQEALSSRIAGARLDVRQLENGKPIGIPIAVRVSGDNIDELRALANEVKKVFSAVPTADRVRDDWGAENFHVKLMVDSDRANLAGVSNLDVALSSASAMSGLTLSSVRQGDRQIPIVMRMRSAERARLSDVGNLYVTSQHTAQKVALRQISKIDYALETEKIRRRNQFRTITVAAFPIAGTLPSEVMKAARPGLEALKRTLAPGYDLVIGGEEEEQKKGFSSLAVVLALSVFSIFLALVLQFQNAIKPLIVFATIPFGIIGALLSLVLMGAPFGFMAFLGIISLIGVIVSHIIVLFDFIEEMREEGERLREALIDAGIVRMRPVHITVGATVLGLFPLAIHGGPLWQPLCYAQIGGLLIATILTLVLVPVFYTIFVIDLKWIAWTKTAKPLTSGEQMVPELREELPRDAVNPLDADITLDLSDIMVDTDETPRIDETIVDPKK